jgi:hypothetical protein
MQVLLESPSCQEAHPWTAAGRQDVRYGRGSKPESLNTIEERLQPKTRLLRHQLAGLDNAPLKFLWIRRRLGAPNCRRAAADHVGERSADIDADNEIRGSSVS